jgi:cold shock CspA family protein
VTVEGAECGIYCEKILKSLQDDQFDMQILKVLEAFDSIQKLWLELNKSPFGMKDNKNKEFTDLLIENSRKYFIQDQPPINEKDAATVYEGSILRIIPNKSHWFGFIKRGYQYENVYFDNRAYRGDISKLLPKTRVKFETGDDKRPSFATKVELIDLSEN